MSKTKTRHVFDYGPTRVIACSARKAREIIRTELGETRVIGMVRASGPFLLADCDNEPLKVSEREYCDRVGAYGDGVVCMDMDCDA